LASGAAALASIASTRDPQLLASFASEVAGYVAPKVARRAFVSPFSFRL
jgi:hypothetical protein